MGASVTVESEVGSYSIFTVDIPLELSASPDQQLNRRDAEDAEIS